jgi:hypothetical protein
LHEITHGLGFISSLPSAISIFDSLIEGDLENFTGDLFIGEIELYSPDPFRRGTSVSHLTNVGMEGERMPTSFNSLSSDEANARREGRKSKR